MSFASIVDFVALGAIWGASFLFMRLAVGDFGVVGTAAARDAIATLFLLPLKQARGHGAAFRRNWWKV